jgi:hypothetical protein
MSLVQLIAEMNAAVIEVMALRLTRCFAGHLLLSCSLRTGE